MVLLLQFGHTATAHAEYFYGLPIPENIDQIEIKDGQYANFATMRFATQANPEAILAFYQARLSQPLNISRFKDITIISLDINQVKKMISITNYSGLADVVLQSDK